MTGPPVKAKRAGDLAATSPKRFDQNDHSAIICGAQGECSHDETHIAIEPPGSVHFAREVCRNCDRLLRWVPRPENVERRRVSAYRIAKMLMAPGLTKWETQFLSSVARQQKFSPRQAAVLERIWDELFGDQ
jgi:hypothetical protein